MLNDMKKYLLVCLFIVITFLILGAGKEVFGEENEGIGPKVGKSVVSDAKKEFAKRFVKGVIEALRKQTGGSFKAFGINDKNEKIWAKFKKFLFNQFLNMDGNKGEVEKRLLDLARRINENKSDIKNFIMKFIFNQIQKFAEKEGITIDIKGDDHRRGKVIYASELLLPLMNIFFAQINIFTAFNYSYQTRKQIEEHKKAMVDKNKKNISKVKKSKWFKEIKERLITLLREIRNALNDLKQFFGGNNKTFNKLKNDAELQNLAVNIAAWAIGVAAGQSGSTASSFWASFDFGMKFGKLGGIAGGLKKLIGLLGGTDIEKLVKDLEEDEKARAKKNLKNLESSYNSLIELIKKLMNKRTLILNYKIFIELGKRELKKLKELEEKDAGTKKDKKDKKDKKGKKEKKDFPTLDDLKPLNSDDMKKQRDAKKKREEAKKKREEEDKKKKKLKDLEKKLAEEKYYYNKLKLIDRLFQLGKEYKEGVIPVLINLLKDKNGNIRFYAAKKLGILTGEDFGIIHKKWLKWWKSKKSKK